MWNKQLFSDRLKLYTASSPVCVEQHKDKSVARWDRCTPGRELTFSGGDTKFKGGGEGSLYAYISKRTTTTNRLSEYQATMEKEGSDKVSYLHFLLSTSGLD